MCDIVEKEEEEREREKGKGGFMSFLSRADISRDDYYACVRCLSVSVSSDVMAAKGDFRFFFQFFHASNHKNTPAHSL